MQTRRAWPWPAVGFLLLVALGVAVVAWWQGSGLLRNGVRMGGIASECVMQPRAGYSCTFRWIDGGKTKIETDRPSDDLYGNGAAVALVVLPGDPSTVEPVALALRDDAFSRVMFLGAGVTAGVAVVSGAAIVATRRRRLRT